MLFSVLAVCCTSVAQQLATGERAPKIRNRHRHWVDGREPQKTEYTYIEFVHSRSVPCLESVLKITKHIDRTDRPFRVVLVTREDDDMVDHRLRDCTGDYVGVLSDPSGRIFGDFGVSYVPFGVIVNKRRKAVWFGNPLTAESDFFEKIIKDEE